MQGMTGIWGSIGLPAGHGLLSIPEIETSWRQYSHWINLEYD